MKKTEESLKRLKKGKKSAFSLFGNPTATDKDAENRDEDRIRTQMILDVNAFGKDAESLGVDVLGFDVFKTLTEMVHASLSDGEFATSCVSPFLAHLMLLRYRLESRVLKD
jgi:conserved oligomeric Golgi complex subunit 2